MTTSPYRLEVIGDTPLAYFPLDELGGDPVELKTGNPATAVNTPTGSASYSTGWGFAASSSEYVFIDTADMDDVPGWIAANDGKFSLEAWIKKPSPSGDGAMRAVRWGWYGVFIQTYQFNGQADGYITCGFTDADGNERSVEHYGTYWNNTFHHVVVTHDGSNLRLWVDGNNVATQTRNYEAFLSGTTGQDGLGIGRDGPFNQAYFTGTIDDVAIYNYPLTEAQIDAHYGASRTSEVGTEPAIEDPGGAGPRYPPEGVASSFHCSWDTVPFPLKELNIDFKVVNEPDESVNDVYFWALQMSFYDSGEEFLGGGHTGLQFNPSHPNNHAVNWGGYDDASVELEGSVSSLPSTPDNDNTRDYDWEAGETYSLRVWIPSTGTIRASVNGTTIRDLYCPGADRLGSVIMWSEVFAQCSDPSASIMWRNMSATDLSDVVHEEDTFILNYQDEEDYGCLNTNTSGAGLAVIQTTNTTRINPDAFELVLEPIVSGDGSGTGFIPLA